MKHSDKSIKEIRSTFRRNGWHVEADYLDELLNARRVLRQIKRVTQAALAVADGRRSQ